MVADQDGVYISNPGQTVVSYPVRKWLNGSAMLKQSPDCMRLGIVSYKWLIYKGMSYGLDSPLQTLGSYSDVILANKETYHSGVGIRSQRTTYQ